MRLTILAGFLQLLKGIEQVGEFLEFLIMPTSLSIVLCGLSYQILLTGYFDAPTAAILASSIGLTLGAMLHKSQ
ncbi:MAG: hypothetical protein HC795_10325 [Coleofasciculaceae cyanobacterium RL_1_1]|nr:hypothetical protein [Coleofasciculaceae cyanobacterium RL_1_1]